MCNHIFSTVFFDNEFLYFLFQKIENEIRVLIDQNVKKAKADVEVGLDDLAGDVYTKNVEGDIRNVTPFTPLKHKRVGKAINT